jgi:Tfp pilus assembly protein PilF
MSGRTKKHPLPGIDRSERRDGGPADERPAVRWPMVLGVCCLLALAVFVVFGQTLGHQFINYDDNVYVYENPRVEHGFNAGWLAWALTSNKCHNWHPLTWLSHTLDAEFFGPWAGGHHATSVLLHAAGVLILFLLLWRMTERFWLSAFVAALFAIHPLRVESVAWVAERKDVLGGLFFMLTLGAYLAYVRRPFSLDRYLTVIVCFVLGLMAKPMLVTLPFVLFLLDYWPLGRMGGKGDSPIFAETKIGTVPEPPRPSFRRLIVEKIPLLLLSAASCVATVWAQSDAIQPLDRLPFPSRVANAAVSYVAYLGQMFHPVDLAVIYPNRAMNLPAWQVAGALTLLAAITVGVVVLWRKCPYLLVGWLWYLGMLLPVIGLVQVGLQSRADRYTYLPQIGLYIAIAWGVERLSRSWPHRVLTCGLASALALLTLSMTAYEQTSYWRDSETLFRHALECTSDNVIAHSNLGQALRSQGLYDKAIEQYQEALAIDPNFALVHNNLAEVLQKIGDYDGSIKECEEALRLNPQYAAAQNNLGVALRLQGKLDEAIAHFEESLRIEPNRADAHNNLGAALGIKRMVAEAIDHFHRALEIDPAMADAHRNLGVALLGRGKVAEALEQFRIALVLAEKQGDRELADFLRAKIRLLEADESPR